MRCAFPRWFFVLVVYPRRTIPLPPPLADTGLRQRGQVGAQVQAQPRRVMTRYSWHVATWPRNHRHDGINSLIPIHYGKHRQPSNRSFCRRKHHTTRPIATFNSRIMRLQSNHGLQTIGSKKNWALITPIFFVVMQFATPAIFVSYRLDKMKYVNGGG